MRTPSSQTFGHRPAPFGASGGACPRLVSLSSALSEGRSKRRGRTSGFTLVELMIALVAGLVVSMAMVGLSKQVMNTFHEEARNASAQAALRIGMERLRNDLASAGFMSTGNIVADNQSLHYGGSIPLCLGRTSTTATFSSVPVVNRLSSILLYQGQATASTMTLETKNGLAPDKFDLGGNYTNGEDYVGHVVAASSISSANDPGPCGSQVFQLDMNTAAGWRLAQSCANAPTGCTATAGPFFNAFHPGSSTTTQYMVRIADNSNPSLFQYAVLCASTPVVFVSGAPGPSQAYINIDTTKTPVGDTANSSGACKLTNWDAGNGITRIAAVQVVEWDLQPASGLPAAAAAAYGYMATADPTNLLLTRTFMDAIGGTNGKTPDATTLEIVAEYAIDLKLAFSVDQTANGFYTTPGMYATNPLLHIPFDSTVNQTWAYDVSTATSTQLTQGTGPQRIRSARVRLVTRTALPDRSATADNVAGVVPPTTTAGSPYLYRYCIGTAGDGQSCAKDTVTWARARTDISEVALPNQSRSFY